MGHTYTNLLTHVIFGAKDRRPLIQPAFRKHLHRYLGGIARHEFGRALTVGGTEDHVHGLLSIRPDVALADAMCKWKSLSSGWLHKTITEAASFAWQEGYAAFSVSRSRMAEVTAYIARQEEHHKTRTFEEELIEFLERHGIDYDPRKVWS